MIQEMGRGAAQESTDPKSWVENTNMTKCTQEIGYLQSINYDKHLLQRPFAGKFFRRRHFALPSMSLIFLRVSKSRGVTPPPFL